MCNVQAQYDAERARYTEAVEVVLAWQLGAAAATAAADTDRSRSQHNSVRTSLTSNAAATDALARAPSKPPPLDTTVAGTSVLFDATAVDKPMSPSVSKASAKGRGRAKSSIAIPMAPSVTIPDILPPIPDGKMLVDLLQGLAQVCTSLFLVQVTLLISEVDISDFSKDPIFGVVAPEHSYLSG